MNVEPPGATNRQNTFQAGYDLFYDVRRRARSVYGQVRYEFKQASCNMR